MLSYLNSATNGPLGPLYFVPPPIKIVVVARICEWDRSGEFGEVVCKEPSATCYFQRPI